MGVKNHAQPTDLVEFWKECPLHGFHRMDEPKIPGEKQVAWDPHWAMGLPEIPDNVKRKLHRNLIAHPYLASPTDALVFILFGNPGCKPSDYHDEYCKKEYMESCRRVRKGDDSDLPPFKSARGTGAWEFWSPVFRRLADELGLLLAPTLPEKKRRVKGCRVIREHISVLEACAYHSAKDPGDWVEGLPSAKCIKAHVHNILLPRARRLEILLFVWRKAKFWDLAKHPEILVRPAERARLRYLLNPERIAIRDFIHARIRA